MSATIEDAAVMRVVADAPALTPEQAEQIRAIVRRANKSNGAGGGAAAKGGPSRGPSTES
jgi:hypothetical protein